MLRDKIEGREGGRLEAALVAQTEAQIKALKQATEAEVLRLIRETDETVEGLEAEAAKALEAHRAEAERRLQATSALEARRASLWAREALVKGVLQRTREELACLPNEKKKAYLRPLLEAQAQEGVRVHCAAADAELVKGLLKELGRENVPVEKRQDLLGGVLFEKGLVVEDHSFDELLRRREAEFSDEAARILFAQPAQGGGSEVRQ